MQQKVREVASHLKHALERANIRSMELFRDWDENGDGVVDRKEFGDALSGLGVVLDDAEVDFIFNKWDTAGSGKLEFKELDFAIKGAKRPTAASGETVTSAKEFQKALREKLQGPRRAGGGGGGAGGGGLMRGAGAGKSTGAGLLPSSMGRPGKAKTKGQLLADQAAADEAAAADEQAHEEEEAEGVWTCIKWLSALQIPTVIRGALKLPRRSQQSAFDYVKSLNGSKIEELMRTAELGGLTEVISEAAAKLQTQKAASSAQLNDKFASSAKFQMSYGSLSLFYGGLESLIGPPLMVKDPERVDPTTGEMEATLYKAMECEHKDKAVYPDVDLLFSTSNGMKTTSMLEWEIVTSPKKKREEVYPERHGLRERSPDHCRKFVPLKELKEIMESDTNRRLIKAEHAPMIEEELIAGRLYTGPMCTCTARRQ